MFRHNLYNDIILPRLGREDLVLQLLRSAGLEGFGDRHGGVVDSPREKDRDSRPRALGCVAGSRGETEGIEYMRRGRAIESFKPREPRVIESMV